MTNSSSPSESSKYSLTLACLLVGGAAVQGLVGGWNALPWVALVPALALIGAVLGSILLGIATPTESASVGSIGAMLLAMLSGRFNLRAWIPRSASSGTRAPTSTAASSSPARCAK